jgi:hypothetical protein
MSLELVERGFAAVAPKFGEGVRLIGGFVGGPVLPALPAGWVDVRLVVVVPVERFAGLRPWRDSITMTVPADNGVTLHVNARDVLTWARMMLRGHGGTLTTIHNGRAAGNDRLLWTMQGIVLRCWTEETLSYFDAAGLPKPSWNDWQSRAPSYEGRLSLVEHWLSECRGSGAEPR